MSTVKKIVSSTISPLPAGTFYLTEDEDDDGSLSSGSSESSDFRKPGESEGTNVGGNTQSQMEDDDEEVVKIRQKAFDLINKAGGPSEEDRNSKHWPQSPEKLHYPPTLQFQSAGEQSSGTAAHSYQSPYQQTTVVKEQLHSSPPAREADKLSVTSLFMNCVSDLCKQTSKEILHQGASILSSGYQSVSNYRDTPLSGSYDPIDTSQHGYGNVNSDKSNNDVQGRYHD